MKKTSQLKSSGPAMRTPSPSKQRKAEAYKAKGATNRHPAMTEDSDASESEADKGTEAGIRYITETLIQKLTKQENLAHVNSLSLSLSKDGGKKFKYIENLEKCERLEILNLSHNSIEKIEKLDKQMRLRELNLSHNRISKLEGIEHMQNLQKLNLCGNEIEQIPLWLGKKIRALSVLNLKQNKIFSLQDVSRLKLLKDLSSLHLADNPIANLPHYRLFTIFHLRSLNSLDGQPVTNQEREEAHNRFNIEEIEKLERDMERKEKEIEKLENQKANVTSELQCRDEMNKSLKQETVQQKKSYRELEREMETKNEILKQKTIELTRACQKHYELEQELAFYKIDAKFEPMGYISPENVDMEEGPQESPYIGKARYKRNLYSQEGFIADRAQQVQVGKIELDAGDITRNEQVRATIHSALDVELGDQEKHIEAAQGKLTELRQEIRHAEQQILLATEELKGLEDAVAQKKISEAEKEKLREQLSRKIQLLNQLRKEAEELERQMERQRAEMEKKQEEIEDLETYLNSLNPEDPRHSHVKAQKAGKEQQLDMMDRQYKQLEGRLDEMLSRIAKETEEIKDLEQQLTDGQIAANEALKRDLEAIISGLQEYLESVKGQAKQAHDECRELQAERDTLLQRLAELEEERNQLEIVAMDAENMRKEISDLEQSLQEQQEVNESLRQAQGDLSEYEAELEAQLKERDAEAKQLKEELERRKRLSHMENSALQAELEKDRQALENAVTKAQLLEEKEKESKQLLSQLKHLQGENAYLNEEIHNLQNQLDQVADSMIHPEQITTRIGELKRKLQTGVGEIRCHSPADVLGQNLADLQKQINDILGKAQEEKREGQERQRKLQEELAALQGKAREMPEDYKRACNKAAEARIQSEKRQLEGKVRQQENELRRLNDQLKNMEEIQGLADQQLLEADEEREKLLTELQDLENKRKMEEDQAQAQVFNLEKELKELKRAVGISDKMATSELSNAKDQLKSLHGTVIKLNEEQATEMQEAANFCSQSARASRNLSKAEAEIELLQNILKEREKQLQEEMRHVHAGKTTSGLQQLEIDRLNHTLRKQQAEIDRLKHLLDHARNDNIGEMENLLDEIASLRHALGHQNDYITSRDDPFRRRGYWYYVPSPSSASHCDSLSTKDSGVGLQYPVTSSPARHRCGQTRHPKKGKPVPSAMGRWVYSPLRHGLHRCHSSEDGEDCESEHETHAPPTYNFVPPPGSVIYTVLPDGTPVPQGTVIYGPPPPANGRAVAPGTVIYGPPPVGTQIAYGPPPPHFTIPIIPTGVLHCNVPAHHELENEITRLEDIIDHLKSRRQKEKMAKERLQEDIDDLEHQKEAYKKEMEELRRSTQKRKRKEFIDGQLDSLITELELEKSLQHHNEIVDEIECIEKTLLKRRAELREADRLLIEAENELQNSREKTKEMIEKYNAAKENLSRSESDAEELERRAHETATQLVKADQQLRLLQANAKDLEQHRTEQEKILKEINSVVSSRDAEFQSLNHQIDKMNDNFQKIQADIQVAEGKENHYLQTLREAEDIFQEKKIALERLNNQLLEQQQDAVELDRLLGQKKEELNLLEDHIDQKKAELKEALRDGELNVADRRKEIREVRSLLEDLSVQKGELNAQLNEKKAQLIILKQQVAQEEENLQKVAAQISIQKSELKHVLQMLQLENNELQGAKLQHDQKINELEETQSMLLEGKLELENLQRASQRLHGGVECQRQILERDHQEIELLMSQMHTLQQSMESLNGEKKHLEETNQDLEKKLTQAKKELAAAEGCKNTATGNAERLTADIKVLQKETEQLNKQKQSVKEEMSAQQQILQEIKEELSLLNEELADTRNQRKLIEQDLRNATKNRDDLLREQCAVKEDIEGTMGKYKLLQERKEEEVLHLQRAIQDKQQELSKHDMHLKQIMKDIELEEEHLKEAAARLKDHKRMFEWEVSNRQDTLQTMTSKVTALEERALKLQQEERSSSALEETLTNTRYELSEKEQQLREKTTQLLALQKEMEIYKADLIRLQDALTSERKREEHRVTMLKEAMKSQRMQCEQEMEEKKHENSSLHKHLLSVEKAADDNHEQSKRLLKELQQLQAEHTALRNQLKSQEELDKLQREMNEAVRAIKAQVKMEMQNSLTDFRCVDPHKLIDNVEAVLEANESLQSQLESLKENFPFSENDASMLSLKGKLVIPKSHTMDEHWRGEALREKLRQHEDRLKAQLHQCMSKQADVLSRGRQQTEGSLHSLKRQVDALDDLVSSSSADSTFHFHGSPGIMSHVLDDDHKHLKQGKLLLD